VAGITTLAAANAYLRDVFIRSTTRPSVTRRATRSRPGWRWATRTSSKILCHEEARVVGPDNVVALGSIALQIAEATGRRTCTGLSGYGPPPLGRHAHDWRGGQRLGRYDASGKPVDAAAPVDGRRRPPHERLERRAYRPAAPQRPPALTATL